MPLIIDAVVALLLLFFIWRGKRRGLIKTVAGIFVIVIAFSLAGFLANKTAEPIAERFVSPAVSDFLTPKTENVENSLDFKNMLVKIGVPEKLSESIVSSSPFGELLSNATKTLSQKLTYALLYLVYFILLVLILKLLVKLIDRIFDLPVLNFINSLGGLITGAIFGYLLILVTAIILINLGVLIDANTLESTHILRFIVSSNPFRL